MYQKKKLEREYDLTREIRIIEDFSDSEIESEPDYELTDAISDSDIDYDSNSDDIFQTKQRLTMF